VDHVHACLVPDVFLPVAFNLSQVFFRVQGKLNHEFLVEKPADVLELAGMLLRGEQVIPTVVVHDDEVVFLIIARTLMLP
jgi:hypothetical protein